MNAATIFCIIVMLNFGLSALRKPFWLRSTFTKTQLRMESNDLSALPALVLELNSASGYGRVKVLQTLQNIVRPIFIESMSDAWGYNTPIGSNAEGFLPALVSVVFSDIGDARCIALKILGDLKIDNSMSRSMASKDVGLLSALVFVLSSDKGEAFLSTLDILNFFFVKSVDYKYMFSPELGLLPALVSAISSNTGKHRMGALDLFAKSLRKYDKLYDCYEDKDVIADFLRTLAPVISSDRSGNGCYLALEILEILCCNENNMAYIGSYKDLGLLSALEDVVASGYIDAQNCAEKIMKILPASTKVGAMYVVPQNLDEHLPALVAEFSTARDYNARKHALGMLIATINVFTGRSEKTDRDKEEVLILMGSKNLGLLPALVSIVWSGEEGVRHDALKAVEMLTHAAANREYMGSKELGLLPALMSAFFSSNCEELGTILEVLTGLAKERANRCELTSKSLGLVSVLPKICTNIANSKKVTKLVDTLYNSDDDDDDEEEDVEEEDDDEDCVDDEPPITITTTTTMSSSTTTTAVAQSSSVLPFSSGSSLLPTITLTDYSSSSPTYQEIWALLSDPFMAVGPEKLAALLFELGLRRADELGYCDSAMWADLAAHLKPIPKRVLLHILTKNNISVGK